MNMTHQINKYFRRIERSLPCAFDEAKKLTAPLKDSVTLYLAEHPDAGLAEIYRKFGTPRELYESYLLSLDQSESQKKFVSIRRRKKILITVIIIAACAAIGYLIVNYIVVRYNTGAYYTEFIIEEEDEIIE